MLTTEILHALISIDSYQQSQACFALMEQEGMDEFLAWYYSEYPLLLAIPNAQGHYPIWVAYQNKLLQTLVAIVESDQNPQDHEGSLISRLIDTSPNPPLEIYFCEDLGEVDEFDSTIMHSLLPLLKQRDQWTLADFLFEELVPIKSLNGLERLIDEDLNLKLIVTRENEEGRFIDLYIKHLINNDALDTVSLLSLKGMHFTMGVLNLLDEHAGYIMDTDEKKLLTTFLKIINKITSYDISRSWFIDAFEYLRENNIDLRNYRFYRGENLIQLICNLTNPEPYLKYLDDWPKITECSTRSPLLLSYSGQPAGETISQAPLHVGHTFNQAF